MDRFGSVWFVWLVGWFVAWWMDVNDYVGVAIAVDIAFAVDVDVAVALLTVLLLMLMLHCDGNQRLLN